MLEGIEFNRKVEAAVFDDRSSAWVLTSSNGDVLTARFCVMATGCLSAPNWPPIDGYEDFGGEILHTALWPHDGFDFTGKRVAVIGTGSSGIQSIPQIAKQADHLSVLQRTANYSVPAQNRPLDDAYVARAKADYPAMRARQKATASGIDGRFNTESAMSVSERERNAEFERRWQEGGILFTAAFGDLMTDHAANDAAVAFVHDKIRGTVKNQNVANALCPNNIIGGKRLCVDIGYFETFNRPNVELVDIRKTPIKHINSSGILVGDQQVGVDVIVVATGFDAMTGALMRIDIRGKNGASLRELWSTAPSSYLGIAMSGFPNLFTVTGPGSPSVLTNMIPSIEHGVEWIADCIEHMRTHNHTEIEADQDAQHAWWNHVQEVGMSGLKSKTDSWYLGANIQGKPRVFLPYNGGLPAYREKCESIAAIGYAGFFLR